MQMNAFRNTSKPGSNFAKVEFWVAAAIFTFVLFFLVVDAPLDRIKAPYKPFFEQTGIQFDYYKHYFIPQLLRDIVLFLAFISLNFVIIPRLIRRDQLFLNIISLILVFFFTAAILGLTDVNMRAYLYVENETNTTSLQRASEQGVEQAFKMFIVMVVYTIIKYSSLYLIIISPSIEARYPFIRREGIIATIAWVVGLLLLVVAKGAFLLIVGWVIAVPTAILLYLAGFYKLIPASLNDRYPFISYAIRNFLILFVILIAWAFVLKMTVKGERAHLAALWIFNSALQMFVTVPMIWFLYKRQQRENEKLDVLKKELGQSAASLDFLRSQINPHFLFNALNTIYGTALQEGAERTSEAVQKLGDMMRFMLQENMKEKISLAREIDYLDNYISLQKLRTVSHPDIKIHTAIETNPGLLQVAPMLFIPFVENAFKHGISFREPSYINISLEVEGNMIILDVSNSRHPRQTNDPEGDKSGIGLENVKQRLQFLYSGRHELKIQDSPNDFSVHLSIDAS